MSDDEQLSTFSEPVVSVTPTNKQNNEEWKKYHEDLVLKLSLEAVRNATARRNKRALIDAIQECERKEAGEHKDVIKGRKVLEIITAREALQEAMKEKSIAAIKQEIKNIRQNPYLKRQLQQDLIDADRVIDKIRRDAKTSDNILAMDRKTMSELRRYHNPPRMMHRIVQAALLLMGKDEYYTSDWTMCQKLLNPQGREGMSKTVMDFDYNTVHPPIWARAEYILTEELYDTRSGLPVLEPRVLKNIPEDELDKYFKTYDLSTVQKVSPAAATFYVWSMGTIDECKKNYGGDEDPTPADINKQVEIFHKTNHPHEPAPKLSPSMRRKYPRDARYLSKTEPQY